MKRWLLAGCAAFCFTASAHAAPAQGNASFNNGFYVGGAGLIGFVKDDNTKRFPAQPTPIRTSSDTGGVSGGLGVLAGYDMQPRWNLPFQVELAGTWRYRHDLNIDFQTPGGLFFASKSDISTTDIMLSGLWNIPLGGRITPYVGGGAGVTYVDVDTYLQNPGKVSAPGSSDWNFSWQGQAGLKYAISQRWDFRFDYRYIDFGTVDTGPLASGDRFETDLISHDLRLMLVWNF